MQTFGIGLVRDSILLVVCASQLIICLASTLAFLFDIYQVYILHSLPNDFQEVPTNVNIH